MSRQGLLAAQEHGLKLSSFADLAEAKATLLTRKDLALEALQKACGPDIGLDFSRESLKKLEACYFKQCGAISEKYFTVTLASSGLWSAMLLMQPNAKLESGARILRWGYPLAPFPGARAISGGKVYGARGDAMRSSYAMQRTARRRWSRTSSL
jgi:hypothetical protein